MPHEADAEADFLEMLGELLRAAQKTGAVRRDLDAPDVKAILVGAHGMQAVSPDTAARLVAIVVDGLRSGR
jgi:hypothetical protein